MKFVLERIASDIDSTIGTLWINGVFRAFTIEDEFRFEKVIGETRVISGIYDISLRTDSPMAARYKARYGDWHKGMIWIMGIPNFEYIYLHTGNDESHTDGCIIVGYGANAKRNYNMNVQHSRDVYVDIAKEVFYVLKAGEHVTFEIIDRDRKDL